MLNMGVRPRVEGAELLPPPEEAVVFVANHGSYLDIPVTNFLPRLCKVGRGTKGSELFVAWPFHVASWTTRFLGLQRWNGYMSRGVEDYGMRGRSTQCYRRRWSSPLPQLFLL